jgi:hypothetical protein
MSEQHTADTDYAEQYEMQHENGQVHHAPPDPPAPIQATVKINEPSPRQPKRAWPLTARLAVTVLIIGLATITAMSLIALQTVTKRATDTSNIANSQQASVNAMRGQLAALQAKVATPLQLPKPYKPPAVLQHYGVCVALGRDTSSGALTTVSLTAPTMTGGQVSCGSGTFVSVVP